MKRYLSFLCVAISALSISAVHGAEITATLDSNQVAVGDSAQLTVTINGASDTDPVVPSVPGLDIAHVAQTSQVQFINGVMHVSAVHTYEVAPQHSGSYTIPAIAAGAARSAPLTLRATRSNTMPGVTSRNARPSTPVSGSAPTSPPSSPASSHNVGDQPADARYGFVQLVLPKKQLYVGETVPVEIHAFVPADIQANVNGLPTLNSDALTLNPLGDKPEQQERVVNGRDYAVLTWQSALTAVKAGDFLLSMTMPVTVTVREQSKRRQRPRTGDDMFDQFFNDPFFDDAFAGMIGRQKQVTLSSEPVTLAVQSLPIANRPADFRGAVGNFQIRATATPTTVAAGDPVTLRLEVTGSGAFDRLGSDGLASGDGWKTYPPKSTFSPGDASGIRGAKIFEQVVIPHDASVKEIPALRLSFFNPETQHYETSQTQSIPVAVTGAPTAVATASTPANSANPNASTVAGSDLVPNETELGHFASTLRPVFLQPAFLAVPGVPLCALFGGLIFARRRRRFLNDPGLARTAATDSATRQQIERMNQAVDRRQPTEFFLAARGALQQRLGGLWNIRPETITLAEVESRLNGSAADLRPVFEMADQVNYSGQVFADADFQAWKKFVLTQLKSL